MLEQGIVNSATWNFVGSMAVNTIASQMVPSISIPLTDNFSMSFSPAFGIGANGLNGGFNIGGVYTDGDVTLSGGVGVGGNYWGWNFAATFKGYGIGYGQTSYEATEVFGHQLGAQKVGTWTGYFNYNSFSLSNDKFGDKGDRWRTSAAELTLGKWSFGTYLYTNDGEAASMGPNGVPMMDNSPECVPPWPVGKNKNKGLSTWTNGRPYFAPFYIGYRNGNQVTRIGYSHEVVHNLTQNWVHKQKFGNQNYYMMYDDFVRRPYIYTGNINPYSLWDY